MSGLIVPLLYILVILIMPSSVILFEKYLKPRFNCYSKGHNWMMRYECYKNMFEKKGEKQLGAVE